MTPDLLIVLALLFAAIVMFVIDRPRMDAVALIMITALPLTGVITMPEALAGFSDGNIILIGALFVIGEGLVRTGVARGLGDWLNSRAGNSEARLLVLLMVTVAGLGSMMSSTAVVAIFIPVVLRICQNTGTAPSRLMMPLSVAALISGMLTLVATAPNLVINTELARQGHAGFGFFAFTPFGLPILALGIGYMFLTRRMLGGAPGPVSGTFGRPSLREWIERYALGDRAQRVRIRAGSPLVGQRLDALGLRPEGINLLAIERPGRFSTEVIRPEGKTRLLAGDMLLIDARTSESEQAPLREQYGLDRLPLRQGDYFTDRSQDLGMVEVIVPAESPLVGQTVSQARMRSDLGLTVIGLRHGTSIVSDTLLTEKLKPGDTLLLTGFWNDIRKLRQGSGDLVLLNMPSETDDVLPAADKRYYALGCLALVVGLMVSGVVPNVQAALIGCLLMGLSGCVDMNSAYRSISWKTLVLIVGMLPFSIALQRTGGVDLAADALLAAVGEASPRLVLTCLFVITAGLGLFISNTATAVLMAPVALAVADDLGASPYPFAMIVALAASTAFMTPISSPVNTLVVGPGNYSFGDFVRIGMPFSLIVMAVSVLMVPWLLPPH